MKEEQKMKKTYQTPETTIVLVQTTQMIAASFEETVNENPTEEQGNGGNALSRRRSVWDFDDE